MSWLDEIDLDPAKSSLAMGTRALGERPWLIRDERAAVAGITIEERRLARFSEVADVAQASVAAGNAVCELIAAAPEHTLRPAGDLHPLDQAGRSVQEDLCLMHRTDSGWHLESASLCFPTRWRLRDKIGSHVTALHGPVAGYATALAARVDSLFDRLGEDPVWRRNWFLHTDPTLFQPDQPPAGDPLIPAARVFDDLYIRSERQTLRRVHTEDEWILFTIRVQIARLGQLVADTDRAAGLASYLERAPATNLARRDISPAQRTEILRARH